MYNTQVKQPPGQHMYVQSKGQPGHMGQMMSPGTKILMQNSQLRPMNQQTIQSGAQSMVHQFVNPVMTHIYGIQPTTTGPTMINVGDGIASQPPGPIHCPYCHNVTGQTVRRKIGSTALGWGCALWFWTGLLCWVPCVMDGCKDA